MTTDHEPQFGHLRSGRRYASLRIFDCAQIALSPASVMIATLAVVLLDSLGILVDRTLVVEDAVQIRVTATDTWPTPQGLAEGVGSMIETLTRPWQNVVRPLAGMLMHSSGQIGRWNGFCRFVLGLGLWSLVGLIVCRRSAMLFAGNDESTFRQAVRYCFRRWPASSGAPLIPLAAAALLGLMIVAMGLIGRLPWVGGPWLFVASPILAVIGFAIAFLLLATATSWPFMVAAVAADDCDSFGGLSRAYSGLTGRPWQVAFHTALAALVGLILLPIVMLVAELTIACSTSCAAVASGPERADESLLSPLSTIVHEVVKGIAASYFWSAAVVIYLLVRRDVDGVPVDRVAPDDDTRPVRDPFPVVGMPATDAVPSNGKVAIET